MFFLTPSTPSVGSLSAPQCSGALCRQRPSKKGSSQTSSCGANPLENIQNADSVLQVMVNGRLYDAATMNEIGNHPRAREPFYWQRER